MTNTSEIVQEFLKLAGAISVLAGAMAWHRRGSVDEDEIVVEATDTLLDGLSNADLVRKIQEATDTNIRDQVSIEKAEEWYEEAKLRQMVNRN